MIAMRHPRLVASVMLLAGLVVAVFFWHRHNRQVAAVVRESVPAIPDLSAWPSDYAARVRVATDAASLLQQPIQALGELACLYHANGCYREAQQVEQGLHTLRPKDPQWTYFLADTCQNLGDPEGQRGFLEKTLQLVPYYPVTRLKLAELLFKQGLLDEARAHYEWRLTFVPGDPYALLGLARMALQQGHPAEAVRHLESIIRQSPDFPTAHNLLAGVYDRMGDTARAEQQRRLGSSTGRFVEANDPRLYRVYAWCFNSSLVEVYAQIKAQPRQWQSSLPFYQKAVRLAPDSVSAYEALAGIYAHLDRPDDACATLVAGLAAAPDAPALYLALSHVMVTAGRKTDARRTLEHGLTAARKNGDAQAADRFQQALGQIPP
jgi:HemY protein